METRIYKILTAEDWRRAQEAGLTDVEIDRIDGYVHLSTAAQAQETADKHFAGEAGCVLLEFDTRDFEDLRWEPSRGGALFPHFYGPLEISKAKRRWELALRTGGGPAMPKGVGG